MLKSIKLVAVGSVIAVLATGLTYAATHSVPKVQRKVQPQVQTQVALQPENGSQLPGDAQALDQALQAQGPVKYKVLTVDSTNGEDKTAYLDRVAKEWGHPTGDGLLLVVFTQDNFDVRFAMGSIFREHGVSVDEMLKLVRGTYLPKARQKDAAGGLVALMDAVNQRIAGVAAQAPTPASPPAQAQAKAQATVPGTVAATATAPVTAPASSKPQAQAPAPTPATPKSQPPASAHPPGAAAPSPQTEIGRSLLAGYLNQFKSERIPEAQRLTDFRFNLSNLTPTVATADRIQFQVKFDVLPTSTHASAWLAGNGRQERTGWMVDNSVIMTAVKQGASWKLDSFTTP